MLSLSGDEKLKAVANGEVKKPKDLPGQTVLGDAWVEVAKGQTGYMRTAAEERAVYWYRQAMAQASESDRPALRRKLEGLPGQVPFMKIAAAAKAGTVDKTRTLGGTAGGAAKGATAFNDLPEEGGLLVGLSVTTKGSGNRASVASVQPIYLTGAGQKQGGTFGRPEGSATSLEAREGYAVGAITGKGGPDRVEGFKVVFMRIKGATLDPTDSYESEWVGKSDAKASSAALAVIAAGSDVLVSGDGKLIVGLHGRTNAGGELEAVGLTKMR